MRRIIIGILGASAIIAATARRSESEPGPGVLATGPADATAGQLITHFGGADGQPLVLTVIDPRERWIGVYHIDRSSGAIAMRSTRNITWDRQLDDFNSEKPLPQDIRSSLPR